MIRGGRALPVRHLSSVITSAWGGRLRTNPGRQQGRVERTLPSFGLLVEVLVFMGPMIRMNEPVKTRARDIVMTLHVSM